MKKCKASFVAFEVNERLNDFLLDEIEKSFSPSTVFGWYRKLIGQKYNNVGLGQKKRGQPEISSEVVELIVKLAEHNLGVFI